jgi:membrane-associated protein
MCPGLTRCDAALRPNRSAGTFLDESGRMSYLVDALMALPPSVILLAAFLFPAAEASVFIGLVVPGETAVIVAGVLAHSGRLPLWAVIVAALAGAIVGDQIGFQVGRRFGVRILKRMPRWLYRHGRPDRALAFVRRRGLLAVVLGRWTASLRALVPGVAGMSGLSQRQFTAANVAGGAAWAVVCSLIGFLAGAGFRAVEQRLHIGAGIMFGVIVLILVVTTVIRRFRARRLPPFEVIPEAELVDRI